MPVTVTYELIPLDPDRPRGPCKLLRDGRVIARHLKGSTGESRLAERAHIEALHLAEGDRVIVRRPGKDPGVTQGGVVTPELARWRARLLEEGRRPTVPAARLRGTEAETPGPEA